MAETTRTLITDEDYELAAGAYNLQAALEDAAPWLRARWVAEALEEAAGSAAVPLWDEATKQILYAVTAETLSRLAAKYRDGTR